MINFAHTEDILLQFSQAVKRFKQPRMMRLLQHPYKMVYPKLVNFAGSSKEKRAKTFWGGEMDIILPEIVSTDIWRYGIFEADVCFYLLSYLKEGMTFLDIGGHFGFFSLLASHLVGKEGRVFTFEPTPSTYEHLRKNVRTHASYPNIELQNIAAYSINTELDFNDYGLEYAAFNSAFGSRNNNVPALNKEIKVKAIKIDDVMQEKNIDTAHMVKIDAESAEMHVLQGMRRTLERYKPYLILEVGDFNIQGVPHSKQIITWLQELGYTPFEVRNDELIEHVIKDSCPYNNLLFISHDHR